MAIASNPVLPDGLRADSDVVEANAASMTPSADGRPSSAVVVSCSAISEGAAPSPAQTGAAVSGPAEAAAELIDPATLDDEVVDVWVDAIVLDDADGPPASDPRASLATGSTVEAVARLRAARTRLAPGWPLSPPFPSSAAAGDAMPAGGGGRDETRLAGLEELLGYRFRRREVLRRALVHSSSSSRRHEDNERMEFLGDAVLDLVIREYCYHQYPDRQEGELTEAKSAVVCRAALARAARKLGLQPYLHIGRDLCRKRAVPESLLADAYEAVVAALYLDGGYVPARRFVLETLGGDLAEAVTDAARTANPKSLLQREAQSRWRQTPQYRTIGQYGPDHDRIFEVAVLVAGREHGRGRGVNKKDAEQSAARAALASLASEMEPAEA